MILHHPGQPDYALHCAAERPGWKARRGGPLALVVSSPRWVRGRPTPAHRPQIRLLKQGEYPREGRAGYLAFIEAECSQASCRAIDRLQLAAMCLDNRERDRQPKANSSALGIS
jgi:hypothetical protein